MNIVSIPTGPLAVNTYIVWRDDRGEASPECVVIDPANSGKVLSKINELGLRLKAILITHGHFDHIMGVSKLREATKAKVYIHKLDSAAMRDNGASLASMIGVRVDPTKVDRFIDDGDVIREAGIEFKVLHTPGHTKGGVCFIVEDERVIFSGDTLFCMSYGRTDLPGGDAPALYDSIVYKLFMLKGDYRVLPGHDRETTLDFERKFNPCAVGGVCE